MARRPSTTLTGLAGIATLAALLTSCSAAQLGAVQFTQDDRLHFTAPVERSLVSTPLTISWTISDFTATGPDGRDVAKTGEYAVFIDRAPISVGQGLRALASGDRSCEADPKCPDADYLSAKGVYVTSATSIKITTLPKPTGTVGDEQHEVTVVLLDGTGTRRSESAWYRDFRYPRRSS